MVFPAGYHSVFPFPWSSSKQTCLIMSSHNLIHLRDSMFFPVLPFPWSGFGFNTFVPTFVAQLRCQRVTSLLFQSLWQELTSSNLIRRWSLMFLFIHGAARIWSLLLFLSFVNTGHWTVAFYWLFCCCISVDNHKIRSSSSSKPSSLPTSECWIRSRDRKWHLHSLTSALMANRHRWPSSSWSSSTSTWSSYWSLSSATSSSCS